MRTLSMASVLGLAAMIGCGSGRSDAGSSSAADPVGGSAASQVFVDPDSGETHLENIRQLTFSGNNAESYFSGSGTKLIFQRQEKVDSACDQEYIMNIDGSGMRRISNGLGRTTCGYFYANDTRVLYSTSFQHDSACPPPPDQSAGYVWPLGYLDIFTSKLDGSDLQQLTSDSAYDAEATVSPDGKKILFTSTRDGDIELYTMNIDGTDIRRLTNRVGYDGGAFFSPDGTRIVWRAGYPVSAADSADYLQLLARRLVRPAKVELWVANADGSDPHQITHLGGANFAPFWNSDGHRIIFSSNHPEPHSGKFDLYLVNDDGTGLERVTTFDGFDGFPMWSPDGKKLVWASNRHGSSPHETNLFIADWVE
jgi:TolB protein